MKDKYYLGDDYCLGFDPQTWRKSKCKRCFRSKDEHKKPEDISNDILNTNGNINSQIFDNYETNLYQESVEISTDQVTKLRSTITSHTQEKEKIEKVFERNGKKAKNILKESLNGLFFPVEDTTILTNTPEEFDKNESYNTLTRGGVKTLNQRNETNIELNSYRAICSHNGTEKKEKDSLDTFIEKIVQENGSPISYALFDAKNNDLTKDTCKIHDPNILLNTLRQINEILENDNLNLKKEIESLRQELGETQDQFRDEAYQEFRDLQKELEVSNRNCRILKCRLKKEERRRILSENYVNNLIKNTKDQPYNRSLSIDSLPNALNNTFKNELSNGKSLRNNVAPKIDKTLHITASDDMRFKDINGEILNDRLSDSQLEEELYLAQEISLRLNEDLKLAENRAYKLEEDNKRLLQAFKSKDRNIGNMQNQIQKLENEGISGDTSNIGYNKNEIKDGDDILNKILFQGKENNLTFDDIVKNLYDSCERERDLREQLLFAENELELLRQRYDILEKENEQMFSSDPEHADREQDLIKLHIDTTGTTQNNIQSLTQKNDLTYSFVVTSHSSDSNNEIENQKSKGRQYWRGKKTNAFDAAIKSQSENNNFTITDLKKKLILRTQENDRLTSELDILKQIQKKGCDFGDEYCQSVQDIVPQSLTVKRRLDLAEHENLCLQKKITDLENTIKDLKKDELHQNKCTENSNSKSSGLKELLHFKDYQSQHSFKKSSNHQENGIANKVIPFNNSENWVTLIQNIDICLSLLPAAPPNIVNFPDESEPLVFKKLGVLKENLEFNKRSHRELEEQLKTYKHELDRTAHENKMNITMLKSRIKEMENENSTLQIHLKNIGEVQDNKSKVVSSCAKKVTFALDLSQPDEIQSKPDTTLSTTTKKSTLTLLTKLGKTNDNHLIPLNEKISNYEREMEDYQKTNIFLKRELHEINRKLCRAEENLNQKSLECEAALTQCENISQDLGICKNELEKQKSITAQSLALVDEKMLLQKSFDELQRKNDALMVNLQMQEIQWKDTKSTLYENQKQRETHLVNVKQTLEKELSSLRTECAQYKTQSTALCSNIQEISLMLKNAQEKFNQVSQSYENDRKIWRDNAALIISQKEDLKKLSKIEQVNLELLNRIQYLEHELTMSHQKVIDNNNQRQLENEKHPKIVGRDLVKTLSDDENIKLANMENHQKCKHHRNIGIISPTIKSSESFNSEYSKNLRNPNTTATGRTNSMISPILNSIVNDQNPFQTPISSSSNHENIPVSDLPCNKMEEVGHFSNVELDGELRKLIDSFEKYLMQIKNKYANSEDPNNFTSTDYLKDVQEIEIFFINCINEILRCNNNQKEVVKEKVSLTLANTSQNDKVIGLEEHNKFSSEISLIIQEFENKYSQTKVSLDELKKLFETQKNDWSTERRKLKNSIIELEDKLLNTTKMISRNGNQAVVQKIQMYETKSQFKKGGDLNNKLDNKNQLSIANEIIKKLQAQIHAMQRQYYEDKNRLLKVGQEIISKLEIANQHLIQKCKQLDDKLINKESKFSNVLQNIKMHDSFIESNEMSGESKNVNSANIKNPMTLNLNFDHDNTGFYIEKNYEKNKSEMEATLDEISKVTQNILNSNQFLPKFKNGKRGFSPQETTGHEIVNNSNISRTGASKVCEMNSSIGSDLNLQNSKSISKKYMNVSYDPHQATEKLHEPSPSPSINPETFSNMSYKSDDLIPTWKPPAKASSLSSNTKKEVAPNPSPYLISSYNNYKNFNNSALSKSMIDTRRTSIQDRSRNVLPFEQNKQSDIMASTNKKFYPISMKHTYGSLGALEEREVKREKVRIFSPSQTRLEHTQSKTYTSATNIISHMPNNFIESTSYKVKPNSSNNSLYKPIAIIEGHQNDKRRQYIDPSSNNKFQTVETRKDRPSSVVIGQDATFSGHIPWYARISQRNKEKNSSRSKSMDKKYFNPLFFKKL